MWRYTSTRQEINWGNSLTQGLVFAWLGGDRELISGSPLLTKTTSTGTAALIASNTFPGQRAFSTNGANGAGGFDPTAIGMGGRDMRTSLQTITDKHTFVWIGSHRNTPSSTARFVIPRLDRNGLATNAFTATTGGLIFAHYSGASATWRETLYTGGPSASVNTFYPGNGTANLFSAGSRMHAYTRDGSVWTTLNNGIFIRTTGQATGNIDFTSFAGWPTLNGIDFRSTSYNTMDGTTDVVLIYNRVLSQNELASINLNPYQVLNRNRIITAANPSGGTAHALVSTGQAVGVSTSNGPILGFAGELQSSVAGTSTLPSSVLTVNRGLASFPPLQPEIWTAGDSLTDPAATLQSATKWWQLLNATKLVKIEHNAAVSGYAYANNSGLGTYSQGIDYYQTGGGAYGTLPRTYIVVGFTNDLQYPPGVGGENSVAQIQAAIQTLYTKLTTQSPACRVIFTTPLPNRHDLRSGMDADRQTLRQWLKDTYLPENVIDMEALAIQTVGTTKGDWLPAYDYGDGYHANQAGQQAMADIIGPFIEKQGWSYASAPDLITGILSTVAGVSAQVTPADLTVVTPPGAVPLDSTGKAVGVSTATVTLSMAYAIASTITGTSTASQPSVGGSVDLVSTGQAIGTSLSALPVLSLYRYLMPSTLAELRAMLRARLNEASAVAWSNSDLDMWLNEGARETVRRTLCIEDEFTFPAVAGTQSYTPPNLADCIMVNRVQYNRSGSTEVFPVEYADFNNLDQVWWTAQVQTQATPEFFTMWGMYPNLKIVVYPTPPDDGTFHVYYWRLCQLMIDDDDYLELPMGWHDLAVDYAFYLALLRDRDQRWQEPLARFEQRLQRLTELTTRHTPHGGGIDTYSGAGGSPGWLTGGSW